MWEAILNFLFPMCHHGGHRMTGSYVKNQAGGMYCWHGDCMEASLVHVTAQDRISASRIITKRKPKPFNYWNC